MKTSGDLRRDLDPFDLLRALVWVWRISSGSDGRRNARRPIASSSQTHRIAQHRPDEIEKFSQAM